MVKQFLNHIQRHKLCKTSDKILLGVSGGVDSMVMLHLFQTTGFQVGVAHCNFQLRAEESDQDEKLVTELCKSSGIALHVSRFDTSSYARNKNLSIQLAARELRYSYFKEVAATHGYHCIATAHHLNDNLETVLLNLTRGTGLEGLKGIPLRNENIIRPLLFASRQQIHDYALAHEIQWRDDSSNAKDGYDRNFIRHQVVTKLKEINPGLEDTFSNTIERVNGAYEFLAQSIESIRSKSQREKTNQLLISKSDLLNNHYPAVLLFELIKGYGFNYDQCRQIVDDHQSGKVFYGSQARLTFDRDYFILDTQSLPEPDTIIIDEPKGDVKSNGSLLSFSIVKLENFQLKKDRTIAQLDAERVAYPLTWRKWKAGDRFTPLGMRTEKKLSDFLIDEKISIPDKDKTTVLESNGEIIWVVGMRINERYKVTEKTTQVLVVKIAAV